MLLCKQCDKKNPSNAQILEFQSLKDSFNELLRSKIQLYEPIIQSHIYFIEKFSKTIDALRKRLIQQLDNLLEISKDWITNLIDVISSYSFFEELDSLIQSQIKVFDLLTKIERIQKIHKDYNFKINTKLDQCKLQPEFQQCQELLEQLNILTYNQVLEIKFQQIQKKKDLNEIFTSIKDIDDSIFNVIIELFIKEKISDSLGFLTNHNTNLLYEQNIQIITNLLKSIHEHEFNQIDYSSECYQQTREFLIKTISEDKKIIKFLIFLVHLAAIDKRFIQSGSNSLNLLIQMKVDLRNLLFENINILNTCLIGGNFTRCNLSESKFNNLDKSGVNSNGAQLFNCKWKNLKIHDLNKLEGHMDKIWSVCFSPEGTTLASGSGDCSIRLWDVKTGQQKAQLDGHTKHVYTVKFSPDGTTLASGSGDCLIRLWNVKTGQQMTKMKGHTSTVMSVCFSPDGTTLASGSSDNSIRLWDAKTGQKIIHLDGHNYQVNSVSFSKDGKMLASGSADRSIRLWDVQTGQQLAKMMGHTSYVQSVCFSPDDTTLASGSYDNSIRLWDVKRRQQKAILEGHDNSVCSICFSPDGSLIASGSCDNSIRLWDVKTGQQQAKLNGHSNGILSVCYSPDGTTLTSSSEDKSIRLWEVKTAKEAEPFNNNFYDIQTQFKAPFNQYNPLAKASSYITTFFISQQSELQSQDALILKGQLKSQSSIDIKTLFKQNGSFLSEAQLEEQYI